MKISDHKKLPLKGIKNIIFDWGGVIVNIDFNATIDAFNKLGVPDFSKYYSKAIQNELFTDLEIGTISPEQFREKLRKDVGINISDEDIDKAWGKMLLDIPKQRVDILKKLGKKYRIFLLSNTNQIHEDQVIPRLDKDLGLKFVSLFERAYLSHHIGKRKPNFDIFEHVIKENDLDVNETLFIDDTEMHVNAASKTGILAYHLNDGLDISTLFKGW